MRFSFKNTFKGLNLEKMKGEGGDLLPRNQAMVEEEECAKEGTRAWQRGQEENDLLQRGEKGNACPKTYFLNLF